MSRRPGNHARRLGDNGGLFSSSKSRSPPILALGLIVVGALLFIAYSYRNSGGYGNNIDTTSRVEDYVLETKAMVALLDLGDKKCDHYGGSNHTEPYYWVKYGKADNVHWVIDGNLSKEESFGLISGQLTYGQLTPPARTSCQSFGFLVRLLGSGWLGDYSCTAEVHRALPILKKAYGDSMHKVLHVGPDTCPVVSKLLKEEETVAWGVEPYDIEDADSSCRALVHKGIVRVADIKFPLPYRPKSFSLVIISDALDYLSPRYLNRTLPDLARVSADGLVVFTGYPGHQRAKVSDVSKFGRAVSSFQSVFQDLVVNMPMLSFLQAKLRSATWWVRYFVQTNLEENETAIKKFEQAASKRSFVPNCQIFHLKSFQ
uniref:Uncharacterized protein n=1 Tax=Quercus lobata TaxID=97700 RepID=A0A7N2MIB9_QUELO